MLKSPSTGKLGGAVKASPIKKAPPRAQEGSLTPAIPASRIAAAAGAAARSKAVGLRMTRSKSADILGVASVVAAEASEQLGGGAPSAAEATEKADRLAPMPMTRSAASELAISLSAGNELSVGPAAAGGGPLASGTLTKAKVALARQRSEMLAAAKAKAAAARGPSASPAALSTGVPLTRSAASELAISLDLDMRL